MRDVAIWTRRDGGGNRNHLFHALEASLTRFSYHERDFSDWHVRFYPPVTHPSAMLE